MEPLYINGKFCAQRMTGVQRYARGLLAALDAWLAGAGPKGNWTLLLPPRAAAPELRAIAVRQVQWHWPGGLHAWEQFALPRAARGGRLINLAGSAPAWPLGPQACVMHDAVLFDQPQAYTTVFGAWYRWLFRRLARRATTLITVSAFSRQRLAAALGVPQGRLTVVPGAGEHLDRVRADASPLGAHGLIGRPFVLAVGSRNATKNLAGLFEAWRLLQRADVQLVLVGGSNARVFGRHVAQAAMAGVTDLGPVDDATLKALYQHALALVVPSLYEGFGLPLLEAMRCDCAVAASTAPALRESGGDAALYFDPASPPAIAQALRRLIEEPALRDDLRKRGRMRAAQFGWDASARALLGALERAR
jgi:glycosyltransferase involved in cell wall biosynthesis